MLVYDITLSACSHIWNKKIWLRGLLCSLAKTYQQNLDTLTLSYSHTGRPCVVHYDPSQARPDQIRCQWLWGCCARAAAVINRYYISSQLTHKSWSKRSLELCTLLGFCWKSTMTVLLWLGRPTYTTQYSWVCLSVKVASPFCCCPPYVYIKFTVFCVS